MGKNSAPGPDSVGDTAAGMGSGCPLQEEPQDQGQFWEGPASRDSWQRLLRCPLILSEPPKAHPTLQLCSFLSELVLQDSSVKTYHVPSQQPLQASQGGPGTQTACT